MKENDNKYDDLKRNFEIMFDENEELKALNDDLSRELKKRDDLEREWQEIFEKIKPKITSLEIENRGFYFFCNLK